jgi:hypothetical protein
LSFECGPHRKRRQYLLKHSGRFPASKRVDGDLFNTKRSLDINTSPYSEIDALPGFIQNKMKSSKKYAARLRVDNDPVIGAGKVKNFRPKAVGEPVIEYPADGNPDDVPF